MQDYLKQNEVHIYPLESFVAIFAILFIFISILFCGIYIVSTQSIDKLISFLKKDGLFLVAGFFICILVFIYLIIIQYFYHEEKVIDYDGIKIISKKKVIKTILYKDIIDIIETRNPYLIVYYKDKEKNEKLFLYSYHKEKIYDIKRIIDHVCNQ